MQDLYLKYKIGFKNLQEIDLQKDMLDGFQKFNPVKINLLQETIFQKGTQVKELEFITFLTSFGIYNRGPNEEVENIINLKIYVNPTRIEEVLFFLKNSKMNIYSLQSYSFVIKKNEMHFTQISYQKTYFNTQTEIISLMKYNENLNNLNPTFQIKEQIRQKRCLLGIESISFNIQHLEKLSNLEFNLEQTSYSQKPNIQSKYIDQSNKFLEVIYNKICLFIVKESNNFIKDQNRIIVGYKTSNSAIYNPLSEISKKEIQSKHNVSSEINLYQQFMPFNSTQRILADASSTPLVSAGVCGYGQYATTVAVGVWGCVPCWNLRPFCDDCDGWGCINCSAGYYLSGSWCMCNYPAIHPQCSSCGVPTACASCNRGYYLASSTSCLPCPLLTSCITCISTQTCISCDPGYFLDTTTQVGMQVCLLCILYQPNCDVCANITYCSTCDVGYYKQDITAGNNTCKLCSLSITNCSQCTGALFCTLCDNKYFLDSYFVNISTLVQKNCTRCSDAIINCDTCTSKTACTMCIPGYIWNTTACECTPSFFNLTNCTLCINSSYCYGCVLNAILLSDGRCIFCQPTDVHPNCTACTNLSLCTNCQPTYVLDLLTDPLNITCTLCIIAIMGCQPLNCLTQTFCTGCYNTHYLNMTNSTTQLCTFCNVSLGTPCLQCDNQTTCSLCVYGYYLKDFSSFNYSVICELCSVPISNCLGCTNQNNCVQCSLGYITYFTSVINQTVCKACHYFYLNCKQCNTSVCTICQPPFIFSNMSLCQDCEVGYEKISGYCFKYPGCLTTSIVNGVQICISCANFLNFNLDTTTHTCVCNTGYKRFYRVGYLMSCLPNCGDGLLLPAYEQCDDDNLETGDGCDDYCKVEPYFQCNSASPTKCVLVYDFKILLFNYAYRVVGQHKGILSYTIMPPQIGLKKMNWKQLMKLNFSMTAVDNLKLEFSYDQNNGQLQIHFTYKQELENIYLFANLTFDPSLVRSSPSIIFRTDKLNGINAPLEMESQSFLQHYKTIDVISLVFVIIVLFQFYMGSMSHKMIGLETIQVIQLIYFVRMLSDSNSVNVLSSLNYLKYSTTGYENSQILLGALQNSISKGFSKLSPEFVSIELDKYLIQNVNLSLFILGLVFFIYILTLAFKNYRRQKYVEIFDNETKNKFIQAKRSSEWVYDHFVFPYTMMLGGIIFFNSLSYLQVYQNSQSNSSTSSIETISFSVHMFMIMIYLGILCYEINYSFREFTDNIKSPYQKSKQVKSVLEKIQIDEKNPDKRNYHQLYLFIYLFSYQTIQLLLSMGIFIKSFEYGLESLMGLNVVYLIMIYKWRPYIKQVNYHNYYLMLNYLTIVIFLGNCLIFKIINKKNNQNFLFSIYLIIGLMLVVVLGGCIRIFLQSIYRKNNTQRLKLLELNLISQRIQNQLIEQGSLEDQIKKLQQARLARKGNLLKDTNKYLFKNQIKQFKRDFIAKNKSMLNPVEITFEIDIVDRNLRNQIQQQNNQFFIQRIRQDYSKKRGQLIFGKNNESKLMKSYFNQYRKDKQLLS